ncbi:MAG: sigma-54-dependent Fis family transcriptional regulator [Gammaproteobacteria bacterium]|nr:MAG: sigma-54-dependent Fis family transcriptional regulator [Gammaproteobacteria bacterium]TLY98662.1 MAG: sigma-54-dependent Fis family transcriptional regulator [Gammaproteobacteria bacterium]TLZ37759.1 MAG: sigma-54-dependent Fis family transcriptional regulator [Gammaproteobacteria bacterium]
MNEAAASPRGASDRPVVLVVDDEPDLLELVSLTLSRMNLTTRTASDLNGARRLLKAERFDLCLTDMRLPDGDGLDLVAWIQENKASVPVAVITAHGNVESAVRALKLGAFDFVSKPLDLGVLRKLVGSAIRLRAGADERTAASLQGARLLGSSTVMEQLRDMIARVARSQAPVHICGESGTGKELVARMIHECGARHEGPFVAVNCGAIPTELMESELFGHKRGSFTGAVADKKGLIQSAEGGTLFLDEVADLPLHMQVKLLRVVQEKTVRPVGEAREETVDVRILSATHRNLADLVAQGRFREDLFYRINVIELHVPALRERRGDIAEIAEAILLRLARRTNAAPTALSAEAVQTLQTYPFPGNVRELENVLERALTLSSEGVITPEHIRLRASVPPAATEAPAPGGTAAAEGSTALGSQLESIERDAIIKALEKTRYNKTAAAKLLGMSFRALRYRIKKLGIE